MHLWQIIFCCILLLQKETDLQCLLTKNMIKACKSVVFSTIQSLLKINALHPDCGITGYTVGLALIWAIREARLHEAVSSTMIFNIKLDGRPFAGMVFHFIVFCFQRVRMFVCMSMYMYVLYICWMMYMCVHVCCSVMDPPNSHSGLYIC